MNLTLNPEHLKFIEVQVSAGRYTSAEQVVEEALSRLMLDLADEEIGDKTYAALLRSEEQLAHGEGRPWEEVREEFRSKYHEK